MGSRSYNLIFDGFSESIEPILTMGLIVLLIYMYATAFFNDIMSCVAVYVMKFQSLQSCQTWTDVDFSKTAQVLWSFKA